MPSIASLMVEFHRVGDPVSSLRADDAYIRTIGLHGRSVTRRMPIGQREFDTLLGPLREHDAVRARAAQQKLTEHALTLLSDVPIPDSAVVQLDLVANVSELWAFPFECALADAGWESVILTRRIRSGFAPMPQAWPVEPKVLFLHAARAEDLSETLIDCHEHALKAALEPWRAAGQLGPSRYKRRLVLSEHDVRAAISEEQPTHVHVLAHGKRIPDGEHASGAWGLRLGPSDTHPALAPGPFASAFTEAHMPVVVTLAACDSANVGNPALGHSSLAQALHDEGVPVVAASQLPLTKNGSVMFTSAFYEPLLRGADVRHALHGARCALRRQNEEAGYDWLGLVAYVRLPEGYSRHLLEVGLRAELSMLNAAQSEADRLNRNGGSAEEHQRVEERVLRRLASLAEKREEAERCQGDQPMRALGECTGLMASSNKRLAELRHRRRDLGASREALENARLHYQSAYGQDILQHWCGTQYLALEAALTGHIAGDDWDRVRSAATLMSLSKADDAYWALGSLTEIYLLAPLADRPRQLEAAAKALSELIRKAPADDGFPLESTKRQLQRYTEWWTHEYGFFEGSTDLSEDARYLLRLCETKTGVKP